MLKDRLQSLESRYQELETSLTDPEVIRAQDVYQKYRKELADLTPLIQTFRRFQQVESPRDFAEWVSKVGRTATRCALVLADDLAGCLKVVRRLDAAAVSTADAAEADAGALANELLTFWVSDAAISLRQQLGIP